MTSSRKILAGLAGGILTGLFFGEQARTVLLLALNVFLILMAYYMLKTVREALILGEGTAELKSYLSAGQVVVLTFAVPLYGRLVTAFPRMKLINVVTAFFIARPPVFYVLAQVHVQLGMIYFVWIGVFSLMIVAQFWSFANDVYSKEEGERLLVIVGLGASLGALAGARVADRLIEPLGVLQLMLLGAGVLGLQLLLTNYIDRTERGRRPQVAKPKKADADAATNAFAMVFKTRCWPSWRWSWRGVSAATTRRSPPRAPLRRAAPVALEGHGNHLRADNSRFAAARRFNCWADTAGNVTPSRSIDRVMMLATNAPVSSSASAVGCKRCWTVGYDDVSYY